MKVTVELPDDIFVRFQAAASFRHISLSELLTQALQKELGVTAQSTADKCYELDEYAWPVLNHKGSNTQTTDALVNELRDGE